MDRWQGPVGKWPGPDHGRKARRYRDILHNARISTDIKASLSPRNVSQHRPVFIRTIVEVAAYLSPSLISLVFYAATNVKHAGLSRGCTRAAEGSYLDQFLSRLRDNSS